MRAPKNQNRNRQRRSTTGQAPPRENARLRAADTAGETKVQLQGIVRQIKTAPEHLTCVWSHDGGCNARIPASVMVKQWQNQIEQREEHEGFFHASWRGGVWMAYGVQNGEVRGVYCPTHAAERAGRGGCEPAVAGAWR